MKHLFTLLTGLLMLGFIQPTHVHATKLALIIGIDKYSAGANTPAIYTASRGGNRAGWQDLDGCVNDALSMKEIAENRFGFDAKNITLLKNGEATREMILKEFNNLITTAKKGDVVFVYYAGHGSQVKNSLAADGTGQDQTIVPVDLYDIRNKEFNKLFNALLDKGVKLTLIFDSCHSGAITRGSTVPTTYKHRDLPPVDFDFKDPADNPKPENRGAVILSAAQRHQLAGEDVDDQGNPHGAFTASLIKAINTGGNESLEEIFNSTKAIMKTKKPYQEPVFGADEDRKRNGLFGEATSANGGKTFLTLLSSNADGVVLTGGVATGINPGCILQKVTANKDTVTVEITEVSGVNQSKAKILSGKETDLQAGDKLVVTAWAAPDKPNLKIWYPAATFTKEQLEKFAKGFDKLKIDNNITWIADPSEKAPTHVLQYYKGTWLLSSPDKSPADLGKNPTADQVLKQLPKGAAFFLQLPPTTDVVQQLKVGKGTANTAIEAITNPLDADYILTGRYQDDKISYSLVKPNISKTDTGYVSSLPLHTTWIDIANSPGDSLTLYAVRLGKVNAWLTLIAPKDEGGYPFTLALKNAKTGELVKSGKVYENEKYSLSLVTDSIKMLDWDKAPRYIYVFAIDKDGKTYQLYPPKNIGNDLNRLPNGEYNNEKEIALRGVSFKIGAPFGFDSYFLLTTDEALSSLSAFNSDGVVSYNTRGKESALSHIIKNVGAKTRAPITAEPAFWSIQKVVIKSEPIAAGK